MSGLAILAGVGLVLLAVGIAVYWHLLVAEGAYLGARVVARTYDWVARRYDGIKQFETGDEDWFVAGPMLRGLIGVERPLVLDVATGTGRLPFALLRNRLSPHGQIIGLDLSRAMLRQARAKLRAYGDRVCLVWQDASSLPFDDDAFDAVACLEAIEFLPNPRQSLSELVRVLAPGGLLLVTNRVGWGARLLPGRAMARPVFRQVLSDLPLASFEIRQWQVDYDLAVAIKAGTRNPAGHAGSELGQVLRCPICAGRLQAGPGRLGCAHCERVFPIEEGVVALAPAGQGHQA